MEQGKKHFDQREICKEKNVHQNLSLLESSDLRGINGAMITCKKKRSNGKVSAASSMIKLTKGCRRKRRKLAQLELHTFLSGGVFVLYSNSSLILGKIIS